VAPLTLPPAVHLTVAGVSDAERARRAARDLLVALGFGTEATAEVVLAVSELAMNLVRYATGGRLLLTALATPTRTGIEVLSQDDGPGIPDVALAMEDGYSTGQGLGSGLPAVRRLMDEFEISSDPAGTRVMARKWSNQA
jgi:serine/threonine-protein kinase RsbT